MSAVSQLAASICQRLGALYDLKMDDNEIACPASALAPLCKLRNLRTLSLEKNRLSEVPSLIGTMLSLRKISLHSNQLAELPASLCLLVALENLDASLGVLLDGLEARGLLDEALVIVTADHGEAFGEHGLVEHSKGVIEPLLRVPFVVKRPRQTAGRERGARASAASGGECDETTRREGEPSFLDRADARPDERTHVVEKDVSRALRCNFNDQLLGGAVPRRAFSRECSFRLRRLSDAVIAVLRREDEVPALLEFDLVGRELPRGPARGSVPVHHHHAGHPPVGPLADAALDPRPDGEAQLHLGGLAGLRVLGFGRPLHLLARVPLREELVGGHRLLDVLRDDLVRLARHPKHCAAVPAVNDAHDGVDGRAVGVAALRLKERWR